MSGPAEDIDEQLAALAADWSGRLDRFCADLESKGFRIERDGLTVRVTLGPGEQIEAERALWQGSSL